MLNTKISGDGKALVFLHGYCENLSLWDELTYPLHDKYTIVAIDLPGFGESPPLKDNFSLDIIAESVNSHIKNNLGINNYIVLGHSLGGYIALALADLFPGSINGLGLINSSSFADTPDKKENRTKTADFVKKHGAAFFLKSFVPDLFTKENQSILSEKVEKVVHMGKNLSESVLTTYMIAMRDRPDRSHIISEMDRALFVAGEKDSRITKEDMYSQTKMLNNPLYGRILKNVAHMSMYEAEIELRNIISSFIK